MANSDCNIATIMVVPNFGKKVEELFNWDKIIVATSHKTIKDMKLLNFMVFIIVTVIIIIIELVNSIMIILIFINLFAAIN